MDPRPRENLRPAFRHLRGCHEHDLPHDQDVAERLRWIRILPQPHPRRHSLDPLQANEQRLARDLGFRPLHHRLREQELAASDFLCIIRNCSR